MSNYKVGDKVWVLCEVAMVYNYQSLYIDIRHDGAVFEAKRSDCRPVEPDHDDHPVEFKVGDRVVSWSGRQGVVEAINEIEGFPITVRHSMREQVSYKLGGVKHDDHPVEPAIEACTKTANDQLRQSLMDYPFGEPANSSEIPNSSIGPLAVGDAVRFVSPGHDRHGTEGTLKSIHHGPKNAYLFVSNCGQFHRYCTIAELEHYNQADPIDIKGSMQSLDGADTIQAGDLQWTDRDSKYRLCNFTIGMRVHEAIQRGKAHGEKWVFYGKFKEVGE